MAEALLDAAADCDRDQSIRCVLLTAAGKLFCGGGGIYAFAEAGDRVPQAVSRLTGGYHAAVSRLSRMEKPLVTAINGGAAGAGLGLAIMGDIVVAGANAHFSFGYTAIGFSSDGGVSWLLPRLVGMRRAQDMIFTNRRVAADEAAAIGLATRVVAQATLQEEAMEIATRLAAGATRAFGRMRGLLLDSLDTSFETHLEREARAIATSSGDAEGREGVRAFIEKRAPFFPG
jgi:2-(1,2-epoxy-1,2-dihydrophenyl)acetyl-CoA isomerase